MPIQFAGSLFASVVVCWILCWIAVAFGPKSMGACSMMTATLPFLFLFVCLGGYVALNDSHDGSGAAYYLGAKQLPTKTGENYDPF